MKYANRAKNIKMRVEPNKKMVYMHISAYKSIIADLRDEIDKLKEKINFYEKTFPLTITRHKKQFVPTLNLNS